MSYMRNIYINLKKLICFHLIFIIIQIKLFIIKKKEILIQLNYQIIN